MINKQLNYRVSPNIHDNYKQTCLVRLIDPGKLLEKFMDAVTKHPELIQKIIAPEK